jgi:DNA-binding PadR family transcriptional regulator
MANPRTNPLALAVLACLVERPMHPYEMSTTMRTRAQHESIKLNYGSLYTVVGSLERKGFITQVETLRDGRRPERTVYAITDAGRLEYVDWLSDLLRRPIKEYPQFEAGLALLGGLPPDEVAPLLRERALALDVAIRQVDASVGFADEQGVPEVFTVETQYRKAVLQAELAFVRDLAQRIEDGTLGGLDGWTAFHAEGA